MNTEGAAASLELEDPVPEAPWALLSEELQWDVAMMGAIIGVLFSLRVVVGHIARGRALSAEVASLAMASFETARVRRAPSSSSSS